jgi:hypothetical protein
MLCRIIFRKEGAMKLRHALLLALLSSLAIAQQNALVVQQTFSAAGSSPWYPIAGYTNHTLTWSQVGSTAVTGCAVQVDSNVTNTGSGTAGGIITSQSATTNGTTAVTSISDSYARITVTGCSAGSIKVTYSAVNGALSKGSGGGTYTGSNPIVVSGTTISCPTCGTGTGTVNSGTATQIAEYSASGTAVSGDANLTDTGVQLSYAGTGGFTLPSDGVHSSALGLIGNTTLPTGLPTNDYFGFVGPNSASFTSYFFQPNATPPTNGQALVAGTPATCTGSSATCIPLNFTTISGGGGALNAITNATAANTPLANGNFPQVWGWAQTTNSQTAFLFDDTSAATGTSDVLVGATTSANSTETALGVTCGAMSTVFPTSCFNVALGSNTGATNVPGLAVSATWNNASIVGPLISAAVTNTSSSASSVILSLLGGSGGGTAEFQVFANGLTRAAGAYEGTTTAINTVLAGGQQTASNNGAVGGVLEQGSDNSNAGTSATAGYNILRGGILTAATPGAGALEGMTQVGAGAIKGSAIANVGDVVCGTTTSYTVTDCPTGAVNVLGIATSTTNPIAYVSYGDALVKLDTALTALGDIICAPPTGGTAGLAHDNGSSPCTTSMYLGTVKSDSGTITGMSGNTTAATAMSTTLPQVQLHIAPASSTGSAPALSAVTGSAAAATGTETAAGNAYTFAGVETTAAQYPFVFQNSNSTNNNASGALLVNVAGTSTGQIGLIVNSATAAPTPFQITTGGTVTNGAISGQTVHLAFNTSADDLTVGAAGAIINPGGSSTGLTIQGSSSGSGGGITIKSTATATANASTGPTGQTSDNFDFQLNAVTQSSVGPTGIFGHPGIQIVSGADYTNSTTTPSTVFSWTLPATAAAKTYAYTCDILWESTNTTLVGPVFGVNISAAPTQLTAAASVQNTLAGADVNGYLSNTTTGSQTVVTSAAAGVASTNYWAKIWGTIEGSPTAGATFIINAASTSATTATLNIRRGSRCELEATK